MSRPFPDTFEREQSPMTPASATSSNTPISYKANVNRQKTKKWADAKPASYGGDDWGDDDEYDIPPPVSKPTGFRQQGQAIHSGQKPESPVVGDKKNYGDLPPLPFTTEGSSSRPRANSFDADDEKRNFSSGSMRQPSPAPPTAPGPATRFSQITGQSSTRDPSGPPALSISTQLPAPAAVAGLRKASAVSPESGYPHPDVLIPGQTNSHDSSSVVSPVSDSRAPSIDYQARRDYSPSAVVPPLHTRGSPAPQSVTDSPSARFPARKSSLSQSIGPDVSEITHSSQEGSGPKPWIAGRTSSPSSTARSPATHEGVGSKPWVAGRSSSPSSTARSPTAQGKALPFIRPADIYRRMEEEREKERQSLDSGRPSMDSIVGAKSSDRSESPAARQLKEKSSSESLSTGGRRRTSMEGDDTSDSGRLKPMLEPVRERKSEYGFEGFNVNDRAQKPTVTDHESHSPERDVLEVEKERRSSTSPKLPDLNRISGFGMDLFAESKTQKPEVPSVQDSIDTPVASSDIETTPVDDPSLRNKPSLGFRSVVNQAFDRREDSSVPDTPTSRTNSDIRRTDSESTGTAGISPIMSRVPSSAAPDSRTRDISNPSILEVVNESNTVPAKEHTETSQPDEDSPPTPPGNNPARAPNVAKPTTFPPGQEELISDSSPALTVGGDADQLQPPRPIAEREHSFRPNLPGGWTSYATSVQSETSSTDHHAASDAASKTIPVALNRTQIVPNEPANVAERGNEDELDITPTTSKDLLPQSSLATTALGAAVTGTAAEQLASKEVDRPIGTPRTQSPVIKEHHNLAGNATLPTPDVAMAPSGSLHSTSALDPQVHPQLENAPPETQLRPDTVNRANSADSSEAPTPPDKDTREAARDDNSDHFPRPPVPLKQKTLDEVEAAEKLQPPTRPHVLPTLSTDTREQDDENDKLRKEIINSLSPKPSNATQHNDSLLPDHLDDQLSSNPARISSYLPSEYDNYWATSIEEESPAQVLTAPAQREPDIPIQMESPTRNSVSSPENKEPETSAIQPLSSHRPDQSLGATRPLLQAQRFSWQASSEDVSVFPGKIKPETPTNEYRFIGHETREQDPEPAINETVQNVRQDPLRSHPTTEEPQLDKEVALIAGGAALAGGAAIYNHPSQPAEQPGRRLSLAEEKNPLVSSSYPVSPTPPEDQHPARVSGSHLSPHADHPAETPGPSATFAPSVSSAPPSSVSPINSPIQPQFPQSSKILAFRDIVAIKSPAQRIQTFDETRHKFANVDYGLTNWMVTMKAQHPEHANTTASFGGSRAPNFPNGSARGKFGKAPVGAPPPPQQPYYQQYLNASSPTSPGTPGSRPGPQTPVGSQQGLSSAGTKITTQQVQAKGKELLHTAGVFGGKAGKAGKGLLAKGKNKLRGAGGGDKNSSSPPPKSDRRTSWGLPLTLSRSSGRPDGSARNSREESSPFSAQPRQRAATLTLDTSHPPTQSQMTAATDDSYGIMSAPGILDNLGMSGALPAINQSPLDQNAETSLSNEIENKAPDNRESDDRNGLNVPAPIGKNQPSLDPFNATPIVEEDGFQWEERPMGQSQSMQAMDETDAPQVPPEPAVNIEYPRHQSQPMRPADEGAALTAPIETAPKSVRSNSGETEFHDASERPSDLSDWVMVPNEVQPQTESKDLSIPINLAHEPAETFDIPPSVLHRPNGSPELGRSVNGSALSVMNRPRGDTYTSILDRPRYSYDVPREVRPTEARSPPSQQKTVPQEYRPPANTNFSALVQTPAVPQEYFPPPVNTNLQNTNTQQTGDEPPSSTSFKGLPPIRRTSTFGLGFGSRQAKKRFAIEDEEEAPPVPQQEQSQIPPPISPFPERPAIIHTGSSEQSQRTIVQAPQSQQMYNAPKAADFPAPVENFRRSQDAWRPNAVTSLVQPLPPASTIPPRQSIEQQRRSSFEQQGNRALSFTQRPDVLYNERMGRTVSNQQARPFEVPPSSAQRYPDLFRQEQPGGDEPQDGSDLPAHYYQPPIPREAAFLPRQQTNEYQLPGVGPPSNDQRPSSRRNSGIFKDLGNKIRSASRERSNSISREGGMQPPAQYDTQGNEYAPSSITSEDTQEQNKRRNSFFGMNRASTVGMGPPQSRESMVAHNPGSRTDLLLSTQPSPITSPHDRKRSFFGNSPSEQKPKANKLSRASTSIVSDEPVKKKRFSGLSNMFGGRSSRDAPLSRGSITSERPQATRELSHHERQPIESPMPDQRQFLRQPAPTNQKAPSQQRSFLTKITAGGDSSQPGQESKSRKTASSSSFLAKVSTGGNASQLFKENRTREDSSTRKNSSAGLLSGFMGRRSDRQEKSDSSSQGARSQGSQPQYRPNQVPPAQTYTDLQEQPTLTRSAQSTHAARQGQQEPNAQTSERGRRPSREPRYDSVPIPGGYSLVRGQGAIPVATEYDPRGYNRMQPMDPRNLQDPRVHQNSASLPGRPMRLETQQSTPSPRPVDDRRASGNPLNNRPPNLEAMEPLENYQGSSRRLSREDLIARSPARAPEGQQRPYQLSLPEDMEDRETRPTQFDKDVPIISPPSSIRAPSSIQTTPSKIPQHSSIQRLNQPTLRHPQSPAGYPLPDDTVFSPINPSANNLPPPPPPKWPAHLDNQDHHHLHLNPDLDRSNTFRTAVSGISQMSGMSGSQRLAPHNSLDKEMGGREGITPSPTPPSPGMTPPPQLSPSPPKQHDPRDRGLDTIRTTTLNRGPSPDLYNASPRLPKLTDISNGQSTSGNVKENHNFTVEPQISHRRVTNPQEEKIFYDKDRLGAPDDEDDEPGPASMSATSYPGQEWNPYAGVYEDDY